MVFFIASVKKKHGEDRVREERKASLTIFPANESYRRRTAFEIFDRNVRGIGAIKKCQVVRNSIQFCPKNVGSAVDACALCENRRADE